MPTRSFTRWSVAACLLVAMAPASAGGQAPRCGDSLLERDSVTAILLLAVGPAPENYGPGAARDTAARTMYRLIAQELRALFALPGALRFEQPTSATPFEELPALQAVSGRTGVRSLPASIAFDLSAEGEISAIDTLAMSGVRALDEALLWSLIRADSTRALAGLASAPITGLMVRTTVLARPHEGTVPLMQLKLPAFDVRGARQLPGGPEPVYPSELLQSATPGAVLLDLVVTATGSVASTSVRTRRYTHPAFMDAVLAVLPRLTFAPALINGCPMEQRLLQSFNFRLRARPGS